MSDIDPTKPLLLPEKEPSETATVLKAVAWFMAHPRVWALAAIALAALCHFHAADHFQGWTGQPFESAVEAQTANTPRNSLDVAPYDPTTRGTP